MSSDGVTKVCNKCRSSYPLDDFNRNRRSPDGRAGYCKPCKQEMDREAAGVRRARDPIWEWARQSLASAKRRAKVAGVAFAITVADIAAAAVPICPALGIPLRYLTRAGTPGREGPSPDSPTVDRVRGWLGYRPDNIVVMSFKANRIKNDSTLAELEGVAKFVRSLHHSKQEAFA